MDDPAALIAELGLQRHPEGGWYRQTWAEPGPTAQRPASTAIYYLLRAGELSRWHRVDATEVWHHYAGAPLEIRLAADDDGPVETHRLGTSLAEGERPQLIVPAGEWQTARSLGAWTLAGCTVSPGFTFDGFELAADGWQPGGDRPQGPGR
jgi:hypothetical protein